MSYHKKNKKPDRLPYSAVGVPGFREVATLFNPSGVDKPGTPISYTFTNTTGEYIDYTIQWIVNALVYSNPGSGVANPFLPSDNVHIEYNNLPSVNPALSSPGLNVIGEVTSGISVFSRNGFTPATLAGTHTAIYMTGSHTIRLLPGQFVNFNFYLRLRMFEVNGDTSGGITRSLYEQIFKKETIEYLK